MAEADAASAGVDTSTGGHGETEGAQSSREAGSSAPESPLLAKGDCQEVVLAFLDSEPTARTEAERPKGICQKSLTVTL